MNSTVTLSTTITKYVIVITICKQRRLNVRELRHSKKEKRTTSVLARDKKEEI